MKTENSKIEKKVIQGIRSAFASGLRGETAVQRIRRAFASGLRGEVDRFTGG